MFHFKPHLPSNYRRTYVHLRENNTSQPNALISLKILCVKSTFSCLAKFHRFPDRYFSWKNNNICTSTSTVCSHINIWLNVIYFGRRDRSFGGISKLRKKKIMSLPLQTYLN